MFNLVKAENLLPVAFEFQNYKSLETYNMILYNNTKKIMRFIFAFKFKAYNITIYSKISIVDRDMNYA